MGFDFNVRETTLIIYVFFFDGYNVVDDVVLKKFPNATKQKHCVVFILKEFSVKTRRTLLSFKIENGRKWQRRRRDRKVVDARN